VLHENHALLDEYAIQIGEAAGQHVVDVEVAGPGREGQEAEKIVLMNGKIYEEKCARTLDASMDHDDVADTI
jgi:hypothetical protein